MGLGLGQDLFTSLNNKLRESYEGKAKKKQNKKKKLLLSSDFLLRISISNCKHPPLWARAAWSLFVLVIRLCPSPSGRSKKQTNDKDEGGSTSHGAF